MDEFEGIASGVAAEIWRVSLYASYALGIEEAQRMILRAMEEACRRLVRRGTGESPMSDWKWRRIVKTADEADPNHTWVSDAQSALMDLVDLVRFLEARVAFLSSDNEGWLDGYRQGVEEGKSRCVEALEREADHDTATWATRTLMNVSTKL